ncbi:MAG TPA: crosslink repair DNA glycosylase YcaQ family protein, partial [Polyangia bacterium]
GVDFWRGDDDLKRRVKAPAPDGGAHLLPAFDEYLIAYADRSAVLAADHVDKIVPGGNGIFMPTIVLDGPIVGTWRRKLGNDTVDIGLVPFKKAGARMLTEALAPAADRYAAFLGRRLASLAVMKAAVAVKARLRIPEAAATT